MHPCAGQARTSPCWKLTLLAALTVCSVADAARADVPPPTGEPSVSSAEPAVGSRPPPEPATPPGYDDAIAQGIDEHRRGHFQEAREHFRAAHELYPNARSLRALGKVEFELRNYGESLKFLTAALASDVRPLTPPLREDVERVLERARAYVGEVHVDVQPGSATVSVDGVTVASGPQAALALLVGDHVLEFRATGRLPERRHVRVNGRDQIEIHVVLAPPELPQGRERPLAGAPIYARWWLWTGVAVVAAGVATAVAVPLAQREPDHAPVGGTSAVFVRNP